MVGQPQGLAIFGRKATGKQLGCNAGQMALGGGLAALTDGSPPPSGGDLAFDGNSAAPRAAAASAEEGRPEAEAKQALEDDAPTTASLPPAEAANKLLVALRARPKGEPKAKAQAKTKGKDGKAKAKPPGGKGKANAQAGAQTSSKAKHRGKEAGNVYPLHIGQGSVMDDVGGKRFTVRPGAFGKPTLLFGNALLFCCGKPTRNPIRFDPTHIY